MARGIPNNPKPRCPHPRTDAGPLATTYNGYRRLTTVCSVCKSWRFVGPGMWPWSKKPIPVIKEPSSC